MAAIQSEKFVVDLQFIMQCLREVLVELGHPDLVPSIPWLPTEKTQSGKKPDLEAPQRLVQLLSISFQLLNMVEENTNVQHRRAQQSDGHLEGESGLWPWTLRELQGQGYSEQQIKDAIRQVCIEPVLTAHPTEAKRATVLEHHRDLYLLLVKRENQMWTVVEQDWLKQEIKTVLERLWRTGEIYVQRPNVAAERRNVMHYLKNVFPDILPWLDNRFETAWQQAGFATKPSYLEQEYPRFELGTWVGGDRDGHPLVTADITAETLKALRLNALIVLRHQLVHLAKKLSLSDTTQKPPESLLERLSYYAEEYPEIYKVAHVRNPAESWRMLCSIILDRLPIQVIREHATQLDERPSCYQRPTDLLEDLTVLHKSLIDIGAEQLARTELKTVLRVLQTFGFHSARLDVRQNSQFHDKALGQLLALSGVPEAKTYPQWSHEQKAVLVEAELELKRPLTMLQDSYPPEAKGVLSCYHVLRDFGKRYGFDGIGSLIVSMTHAASDLFTVYLLAREAGLLQQDGEQLICPIPVVPLFETISDLEASLEIMDTFLRNPITRASLEYQRQLSQRKRPLQQIMIGYSDSSKDGGVLASQWHLYLAQKNLQELAARHEVEFSFFHGRGGTVSRGAGPVHRFLEALPRKALKTSFRMTEQGETIARKYANFATAVYNIELLEASVIAESIRSQDKPDDDPFILSIMQRLSNVSQQMYQDLIRHPDFMKFYREATPIDILEHARIGSRPSKRTGQATLDDLRAIPWVFSWNQSRFYLPSWYGVGTALANLAREEPEDFARLQADINRFKLLNYVLFNVETTVASASLEIMEWYGSLVQDVELRKTFMDNIRDEFELTRSMLIKIFGSPIEERRPHVIKTIALREQGLRVLHLLQIKQLKNWRLLRSDARGSESAERELENLLVTINAIASGLRNTG